LLSYLEKMVFWSDVRPALADLAVLSLLGPDLGSAAVLNALGLEALPAEATAVALPDSGTGSGTDGGSDAGSTVGFIRRMPATDDRIELDLLVPTAQKDRWLDRLAEAGVRPAGVWAYEAHRVATRRPRLGVDTDERTIPHEVGWIGPAVHLDKGCYRGQETVARVHNLGRPPRMLVLLHLDGSGERPATGDPLLVDGRQVGRLGTVVDHADLGPIALALLKRGIPAGTPLRTGGEHQVAAEIDEESLPPADVAGAGRVAVDRLRHGR
ncbi:MAG TPA: folate-binding protein, partial [Mycobacterium sp.]|nr:folate-binding protein [Mycobacterium sp.]